jgi:membrane protein
MGAGSVVALTRAVLLVPFEVSIGWGELLRRTIREINDDDCLNLAAQLSYYFFLSLFPAVLFLLAVASFFPLTHFTDDIVRTLSPITPPDVLHFLSEQMTRISNADSGGILTIGILGAVWSSSAALVAIINSLNRAYGITESRPWWKVRLIAMALTMGLALFLLLSFTLILAGPTLAEYLSKVFGLGVAFEWGWKILQWPLAFLLVSTAIGLVYYFAPDAEQDWVWITPGAVVATLLWIVASLGVKVYLGSFTDYNATYGAVGGVMALLLWFYISGLAILIGAEINSEIEHASAHGKDEGEKFPGAKKKLGTAAARAYKRELLERANGAPSTGRVADQRIAARAMEVRSDMPARYDDRTLGEMFTELSRDFKTLVQQELQLAKVELSQKAVKMRKGLVLVVGGGLLAYGGFLAIIAGIVLGLVAAGLPYWLAALVAGVVLGGLGYLLVHSGVASLRPDELRPHHTIDTLKEDAQWLRTQAK